jgi:hypothetical protein
MFLARRVTARRRIVATTLGRGAEPSASPRVDLDRELGVAQLVVGDPAVDGSELARWSVVCLPQRDHRAPRLADQAFACVLDRQCLDRSMVPWRG